jgi:hypothetical protein
VVNIEAHGYCCDIMWLGQKPLDQIVGEEYDESRRFLHFGIAHAKIYASFTISAWAQDVTSGSLCRIQLELVLGRWHASGCMNSWIT